MNDSELLDTNTGQKPVPAEDNGADFGGSGKSTGAPAGPTATGKTFGLWVAVALVGLGTVLLLIWPGWAYRWSWTGFGAFVSPPHPKDTDYQRAKTLWDWLQLVIVPLAVAVVGVWLNRRDQDRTRELRQQFEYELELARRQEKEAALEAYLNRMSDLITQHRLMVRPDKDVVVLGRTLTLAALPRVGAYRKRVIVRFLYEAGLIHKAHAVISLAGADLSEADLTRMDLHDADLQEVNLTRAILRAANLTGADLHHADLTDAKLNDAHLDGARISDEQLRQAQLPAAYVATDATRRS